MRRLRRCAPVSGVCDSRAALGFLGVPASLSDVSDDGIPELFRVYEQADNPYGATYWWGRTSDAGIADSFRRAAHLLLNSVRDDRNPGQSAERIFLPTIYVFKHAIELRLKEAIHLSAALRRLREPDNPAIAYDAVKKLINNKIRHQIDPLVDLLDENLRTLGLEAITERSRTLLGQLATSDPRGNAFRFPEQLPDVHIPIDLGRLADDLEHLDRELYGLVEYLHVQVDDEHDWLRFQHDEAESW